MVNFQGVFFLLLGAGLLAIDYRSLTTGWLPCGTNGFKGRFEFHRGRQPLRYWLMFVGYGAAGLWMVTFSIRLLTGHPARQEISFRRRERHRLAFARIRTTPRSGWSMSSSYVAGHPATRLPSGPRAHVTFGT